MKLVGSGTGDASEAVCTASLNPSAAAKVTLLSSASTFTPVSTGRESSVAAAKATCSMAVRRTLGSIVMPTPSSTEGMGGNSSESVPSMRHSNLPQVS